MAKILVTGLDGFTGQYVATELAQHGHEVLGLVRDACPDLAWPTVVCDLLDRDGLVRVMEAAQPDAVIHLAAIAFVGHGDVGAIYQTNVVGTRNLLDALVAANCAVQSVVLASSANIYGNASQGVIGEDVPAAPANDYAVSKYSMELAARLWSDKLPITIVRPFNYTGAGQKPMYLLPKIVEHFRDRKPDIELGNLKVIRDFSDVRTVASIYRRLVEGRFAGRTFNICSGSGKSIEDILAALRDITGHELNVHVNPKFVRENEVYTLIGDCHALEEALGGIDHIPIEVTLRWMLTGS